MGTASEEKKRPRHYRRIGTTRAPSERVIGLFNNFSGAEKTELQAESLGFDADISPFLRDGKVYFVDIGLPAGKGAGDIIERYGEEKVLMRDAATCPQSR